MASGRSPQPTAALAEVTIYEFEFADVAEYDAFWAEWGRTRGEAFFAQVDPLAEGFTFELLRVRD